MPLETAHVHRPQQAKGRFEAFFPSIFGFSEQQPYSAGGEEGLRGRSRGLSLAIHAGPLPPSPFVRWLAPLADYGLEAGEAER